MGGLPFAQKGGDQIVEDKQKLQLFESTPVPRAVMTLAIPTVLSSLVMVLYNLADTYFVGMLNDPIQNAAVTLAGPVLLAFNAVNNLFGVGSSSMMSRALGAKDFDTVRRSSAFGFYLALFSGVLFSVLVTVFRDPLLALLGTNGETYTATRDYMLWTVMCGAAPAILNVVMAYMVRAEGESLHASIGTMSGCILNMILDPFFILPWGLGMGAAGAGLATFLSNCVACLYFFALLFMKRGRTYVCISPHMLCFRRSLVLGVCGVGVPASIQNLLNVTSMTILNNFASAYSSDAVAAMGISHKVQMIPMQIAMGISQGIMPLISYNYASGNTARMKKTLFFTIRISLGFLVLATAGFCMWPGEITALFMQQQSIIDYGREFLRGMALSLPFLGMDFVAVGVFQACGMGSKSLLFAILRKIVLEIPALFILDWLFPLYGLAWAQTAAEFILSIAAVAVLMGLFRRLEKRDRLRAEKG